jgi:hypothetical protein
MTARSASVNDDVRVGCTATAANTLGSHVAA